MSAHYADGPEPTDVMSDYRHGPLVGPLVRFRNRQIPVDHATPKSTLDPRYAACSDHHLACDCREAEQAESLREMRLEYKSVIDAIAIEIEGHPTRIYGRADLECQCIGCKVARRAHAVPRANNRRIHDSVW